MLNILVMVRKQIDSMRIVYHNFHINNKILLINIVKFQNKKLFIKIIFALKIIYQRSLK